jgi:hypothetical protein
VVADETEGYEADKMIIVDFNGVAMNLTEGWDGTVDSSLEQDGKKVYFTAAVDGTKQLFE